MVAKLVCLYGHPTDPSAFDDYYQNTHAPLAWTVPGLRSFTANASPLLTPDGPSTEFYRISTLVWDTFEELQTALASPEGGATAGDLANFATGGATVLVFDERDV